MSPSDYVKSTVDFLDQNGWDTSPNKVRDGVYIVLGQRDDEAEGSRLVMMVVTEPESQVTKDHLSYLHKIGKKKSADKTALSSNIDVTEKIKQTAQNNNIQVIEPDAISSEAEPTDSDSSSAMVSQTNPAVSSEKCYNIYPARIRTFIFGTFAFWMGYYGIQATFSNGLNATNEGVIVDLSVVIMGPIFAIMGAIMCLISLKNVPLIQITNKGLHYNDLLIRDKFFAWDDIDQIQKEKRRIKGFIPNIIVQVHANEYEEIHLSIFGIKFDEVAEAVEEYSDIPINSR